MIGKKIRQLRLSRRISQVKLASRSGYSRQWINQVESGRKHPSTRFYKAILELLTDDLEGVAGDE